MAADNLTIAPDFVLTKTPEYSTKITQFENGVEQRRAKWATPIRRWKLTYSNRSQADFDSVSALFASQLGQATAFLWTCPIDSTQYTVRFASDKMEYHLKAYQIYDFEFELVQVQ